MKNQNYFKLILLMSVFYMFGVFKSYSQEVYATSATELSSGNHVNDEGNAAADNGAFAKVKSYGGLAVGIGRYSGELKLEYPSVVPANTTTYIKVDDGDSGLLDLLLGGSLGGLLSNVVGSIALGDHYVEVSALDAVGTSVASGRSDNLTSSGILNVVRNKDGDVFFAITPTIAYKSVVVKDVTNALLLGTSSYIDVYHAFYQDLGGMSCNSEGIFTFYDGTGITLGLLDPAGVLGTTGVENPEFAIDNDDTTYSKINVGIVSALATMYQDIQFPTVASTTDQLEISIRGREGVLANVAVLQNINISLYKEGVSVYTTTADAAGLIALLPSVDGDINKISVKPGVEFDRLRVTLVSPVGVNLAQQVDLFGARVTPVPPTLDVGGENQSFCTIQNATVTDLAATVGVGSIVWYDQEENGTAYESTDVLVDGNTYYGAALNGSCESLTRVSVTVAVSDSATPTSTKATQEFCAVNTPKISELSASVVTGTITWYNQAIGGTAYANTDVLVDGQKYYAANTVGSCESSSRLEITVAITNPVVPTAINSTQSFCAVDTPTIADLIATASGTIIWYNQATGGTAYVDTDILVDGQKYYAANSDGSCESSSRLEITVSVSDVNIPTTSETTQSFCTVDAPTIADLVANASGTLVWYNQLIGGTAYLGTDVLVNGQSYYAADVNGSCESSLRLEVVVEVADVATPTTTQAIQNFCTVNTPLISNLSANVLAGTIIWYNQAVGGTAYANSDILVDGNKYYAANLIGSCESNTRLEVAATILDVAIPTSTKTTQIFCAADAPNISDLVATASGTIIWYNQAVGGTAYADTDVLVDGDKYYGANSDGSCESSVRLEITVVVTDPSSPTATSVAQSFCVINSPTVADLNATGSGTILWYNQAIEGATYVSTDALINGNSYYAVNVEGGCESSTRLKIVVTVENPLVPTTTNISQSFCAIDTPTIANLEATASGTIIWYNQAVGGVAYTETDVLVNDTKYYAANLDRGCQSDTRLEVTVAITSSVDVLIEGSNTDVCYGSMQVYEVPLGYAPYTWSVLGGTIVSGGTANDNTIEVEWTSLINTEVSVDVTGGCFNTNSIEQIIDVTTCSDIIITSEVDILEPSVEDIITFDINIENTSLSVFTDVVISEILTNGFTYVSSTTSLGTYNGSTGLWDISTLDANQSANLTLKVKVNKSGNYLNTASILTSVPVDADTSNNTVDILIQPSCLKVYNNMTPNGDGMNDNLTISCIENYSNTVLEVFNRYGSSIYKMKNYQNDWDGVANQTSGMIKKGEQVPNGTYFYVLKFTDGTQDKTGWIQITK